MEKAKGFWRDLWRNSKTSIALFLGSILFICYSCVAVRYEMGQGWRGHPSVQNVFYDISRFIPVAGAGVTALILFTDMIIFVYGFLIDWRKKRFQEAVKAAVDKARAEGYEAGYAAGQEDREGEP